MWSAQPNSWQINGFSPGEWCVQGGIFGKLTIPFHPSSSNPAYGFPTHEFLRPPSPTNWQWLSKGRYRKVLTSLMRRPNIWNATRYFFRRNFIPGCDIPGWRCRSNLNWSRIDWTILHGERDRCPAQEKTGTNTSGVKEAPRFSWRFLFYAQDTTPYGQKLIQPCGIKKISSISMGMNL